jgi:hypothetical protein
MVEGTIRSIDHKQRTAVIETRDGREISVHFPPNARFEVSEPATTGMMGGTLEDIGVGYLVHADIHELGTADPCHCASVVCIS